MFLSRSIAPALAALALLSAAPSHAATLAEDFAADPYPRGWHVFGNSNLFEWKAAQQQLAVTWDSAQPNSYFHRPLGTVLTRDDDFSLSFDLWLSDIVSGHVAGKTGPAQIAIGFLQWDTATNSSFARGTWMAAKNLAEFDYFPAGEYPDWGPVSPTVATTLISSDFQYGYSHDLQEMPTNTVFHVTMTYTAADQTCVTTVTTNGLPFAAVDNITLDSGFGDFRVDTLSISSFTGNDYDSVLAHGAIDNLVVTVPPPPVGVVAGGFDGATWQCQFTSRSNWLYTLERSTDLQSWTNVSSQTSSDGGVLALDDNNAPDGNAFYRVRAERP